MKSFLHLAGVIVSFGWLLTGCVKELSSENGKPTSLQITLKDASGNAIQGGSVKLYPSGSDFVLRTNQVDTTHISDSSGKVTFTYLHSIQYFWLAEFESRSNINGIHSTISLLASGITNRAASTLTCTGFSGVIKLINNSSNPYSVLITPSTGLCSYNNLMAGGSSQLVNYTTSIATQYSVNVIQQSGFATAPTNLTLHFMAANCNAMDSLKFP